MSRPVIGSRYDGPALDRPCLRQMPAGWQLEELAPPPKLHSGDRWLLILCLVLGAFALVRTVFELGAR